MDTVDIVNGRGGKAGTDGALEESGGVSRCFPSWRGVVHSFFPRRHDTIPAVR